MANEVRFNSKKAAKNFLEQIRKVNKTKALEESIGKFLVERVQKQVRSKKPLNNEGSFPPLEKGTKTRRGDIADFNLTHPAYRKTASNLTFTGQLVDAIDFRRISAGLFKRNQGGLFELYVKSTSRWPYIGKKGTETEKPPNNQKVDEQLRKGVGKAKKKFIMFTAQGLRDNAKILERIRNIYVRFLRKELNKT